MKRIQLIIPGQPPSKSNHYKLGTIPVAGATKCPYCHTRKVQGHLYKSPEVQEYERDFEAHTARARPETPLGYPTGADKPWGGSPGLVVHIRTWFSSWAPDCDGPAKVLLDLLQSCRFISNDSRVRRLILDKDKDSDNPRAEVEVLPWIEKDADGDLFGWAPEKCQGWLATNAPREVLDHIETLKEREL